MNTRKNLYLYFTYAGIIPFLVCTFLFIFKIQMIPILGAVQKIIGVYGLVIASFMTGVHWGQHLERSDKWSIYLPVTSNIISVLLWLLYLALPFKWLLIAIAISFTVLLYIDKKLFQENLITRKYFYTRCIVTMIVLLALLISGIYS